MVITIDYGKQEFQQILKLICLKWSVVEFPNFELTNPISVCITLSVRRPTVKLIAASMNLPVASFRPA